MFANAIAIILYADESDYEYESLAIAIVRSVPLWRCLSPHLFVWLALSALIATPTYSTSPPPRNARWYRWYRHRRCHSPSLFLDFVQRNKPIMPGLSGAGGSWGWVSLSLIDLQTKQAIDMSEWLHDYTHCPFLGTRFGPVIHTAVAHLPPPPPPLVHVCGQPHVSPVQASRKMI